MPIVFAGSTVKRFSQEENSFDIPNRSQYSLKGIVASYLLDYGTLLVLAGLGVTFTLVKHPEEMFRIDDYNLGFPDMVHVIPAWLSAILSIAVPIAVLVLSQIFVRNFHDFHHAFLGLSFSLLVNLSFTGFLWVTVGGNRPDFLKSCNIDKTKIRPDKEYYLPSEICKNAFWNEFLYTPGFPSGHASNAFAAWIFIALYLNAKLRPFDKRSHMWKFLISWIPSLFMPMWITASRLHDHTHSPYQVCVGMLIGIPSAFVAYGYMFCSIFGVDSHVPTFYLWRRRKPSDAPTPISAPSSGADGFPVFYNRNYGS